ncbi:HNH endonuclease family protein [Prauserella muralis]|uniref:GmrSD restriction endonucleases C-terminal domain-containing protein n=1 Tax=Prauserella muralis TaxID=588067 RepID=A0A2V4AIE2_9PSEU|nr:HNH endonuclease family protein [Prauserella muralis]PXY19401.1 hypothetical protein BAY60_32165 [Prauserella muralis]TWE29373.1 uncharacterized protein DUF1524 [Prauserella muralis]
MGARRRRSSYGAWGSLLAAIVAAVAWWTQQSGSGEPATPDGDAPVDGAHALQRLATLPVRQEDTGNAYDRDDWPHWSSHGDGCNTREIALRQQGENVRTDAECRAVSGTWLSDYDGVPLHDASEADLDHLVPLAEAARSGSRGWSEARRERFANDLRQLVVVTARSNRQKGDQDPASWLPERDRCTYAARWVEVKASYGLSVDPDEHAALTAVLSRCR